MTTITISDYRGAQETLRRTDLKQALYDAGAVLMDRVLVTLHGSEHQARRNLELKVFRRDFFRFYESEVFPTTLGQTLAPYLAAGKADLVEFGHRVMLNLTADFAGIDRPEGTAAETERLLRLLRIFGTAATLAQTPRDPEEVRAEIRAAMAEFDRTFFAASVQRRQAALARLQAGEIAEADLPRDVLTILLQNQDRIELTREILIREMAFFLMAGAVTSIHSMVHAMHEIFTWSAARPEAMDRLRRDPGFVQRCVHESTRLHPSSPQAWRKPTGATTLPTGAAVTEADLIVVDLLAANRDCSVFGDDAPRFNPDRDIPRGEGLYGLSFGYGMHACLGRNLAAGGNLRPEGPPPDHQYGTVSLIVHTLLKNGARPDPANPPRPDEASGRPNWGRYPVLFG